MIDPNEQRQEKVINEKLNFYFNNKITVHLVLFKFLPNDRHQFYNGKLIEKTSDDIWVLEENRLGQIHIFVSEIKSVDEMISKDKFNDGLNNEKL